MRPAHLKRSLFGFKRKQVLQYIDQLCIECDKKLKDQEQQYTGKMQALTEEYESKFSTQEHAIALQVEANKHLESQLNDMALSLDEKYVALQNEVTRADALAEQVTTQTKQIEQLQQQLFANTKLEQTASLQLGACLTQLAQKDEELAARTAEVERLQQMIAQLEQQFDSLRGDAEQDTAMVNCLNVLHGRNRALAQKVARLEAELEHSRSTDEIDQYVKTVNQKQEAVKSTETLFSAVRKEIQDALASISQKIEDGAISQTEDGNYFVDMATL